MNFLPVEAQELLIYFTPKHAFLCDEFISIAFFCNFICWFVAERCENDASHRMRAPGQAPSPTTLSNLSNI